MAVDKKISQLASGAPAQAGDEYVVARSGANYKLTLTNIAASMPATTITSGNLTFSSTAQRITGDFSNATIASRLLFQTSTTNGTTGLGVIPNGTGTTANVNVWSNSSISAASGLNLLVTATESSLRANISDGGSTYLPMTFYTSGSERVRIDTSGNVGIGTASPNFKEEVNQGSGSAAPSLRQAPQLVLKGWGGGGTYHSGIGFSMSEHTAGYWGSGILEIDDSGSYGAALGFYTSTGAASASPTEKMRISSTGNVGIGGTPTANRKLELLGSFPVLGGNANSNGIYPVLEVPSAITGSAYVFRTGPSIAASTATTNVFHYLAANVALGSGASLTNSYGFYADAMTSATNNYGFYSNIASGSNRWNFYAAGTAANYFAGNLAINSTAAPSSKIVIGNASFTHINEGNSDTVPFFASLNNDTISSATYGWLWYNNATNGNLDLYRRVNSTTDVHTITFNRTSGEVLIAATTDNGPYNLQCNGTGVWGAGAYVNGSDARLKDNITTLNDGLNVVSQLRPVTFKYKPDYSKDQNVQTGFIAQELQAVLTGKDYVDGIVQAGPNHLNVAYQSLIPILVKAIQELTARVAELEAK
jgi:hypothetical protein